jgi:hypothetical protein
LRPPLQNASRALPAANSRDVVNLAIQDVFS